MTPHPGPPAPDPPPMARRNTVSPEQKPIGPAPPERDTPRPDTAEHDHSRRHTTHRPWSARRIPAAVVAAAIVVAAGATLIDVVAVRAGRQAADWRKHLADELATRPVDDVWMLTGAAVAAAVGIWLIALALSPGLRHWLSLRSPAGCPARLRASLNRDGAAALLRDAAMRVPGVGAAHVRVRRHRIKARADVRFRDPKHVKADLAAVLNEEREQLALTHTPRLVVRVRQRNA
ncbi:DUF6286 domain-containing protein [Streptomyces sp. NPDC059489]|uniref:DUF6286 domain-containing protein n=1 Tax=Streptomyces sp. NPDC059489 TaxID=3346849 RepID=UPI0036C54DDD